MSFIFDSENAMKECKEGTFIEKKKLMKTMERKSIC